MSRLTEQQLSDVEQWAAFDLRSGTAESSGDQVQALINEVRERRAADIAHSAWETVTFEAEPTTRRLRVPGGWLYMVALDSRSTTVMADHPDYFHHGWHPPVFVPARDGAADVG